LLSLKKKRAEKQRLQKADYAKLLAVYKKEERERKRTESKRRSSMRESK
jgi:hypothetical protein